MRLNEVKYKLLHFLICCTNKKRYYLTNTKKWYHPRERTLYIPVQSG